MVKFGRWTFFGQWTSYTRAEMPWIPVHKMWQMNLVWPLDPPLPEQRCLEYQYTLLGRWTYFGPLVPEQRCLAYHYTLLGRWTYFGQWTPHNQSRDALNTSTQYLADEHILANGPSHKVTEERCLHTATDILWSRMAISHCCWHLVVKNGNFTLLLTSSGQEWQFHIATAI